MISKITELYILCRDIQVSREKKQFSIEMISKMTEPCILCGENQIPTEKSVQHWNDFKDQGTLHSLLGHSNPNWKTQIIIQMITKMTDPDIFCWRIQISIERSLHIFVGTFKFQLEKNSSLSKWLQRWQNLTSFVGTLKSQLKNTDYYSNDYKDDRPWHFLLAHSNFNWKKLAYFVGTFKFQLGKNSSLSKWLQIWQNLTSFGGHSNSNWKKTVQYWNDFKGERPQHPL